MTYHSNNPVEKSQCYFCTNNIKAVDYKDVNVLQTFITPQARIMRRKRTGVCALCQRKLATAIKRARFMALIPFVSH